MSAFKDAVKADVTSVFLNLDEFAEVHNINGQEMRCVVSTDETLPHVDALEGVFKDVIRVYISADDMEERPVEGELLKVDGSLHIVEHVSDEMGMYVIDAVENQQ